jgi:hypothetical protein
MIHSRLSAKTGGTWNALPSEIYGSSIRNPSGFETVASNSRFRPR